MAANAVSMLEHQFKRRLRQYIRFRYARPGEIQLPKTEVSRIMSHLNAAHRIRFDDGVTHIVWNARLHDEEEIVRDLRVFLEMVPWESVIKSNQGLFVRKVYTMLEWMESFVQARPEVRGSALYTLLPLSTSYVTGYIPITTTILHGICARILSRTGVNILQQPVGPNGGLLRFHGPEAMRSIFDMTGLESAQRRFANFVYSDGYGITVVFTRPPRPGENRIDDGVNMFKRPNNTNSPSVVIGIDPGLRNLCTAVRERQVPRHRRRRRRWLQERGRRHRRRKNRSFRFNQQIFRI